MYVTRKNCRNLRLDVVTALLAVLAPLPAAAAALISSQTSLTVQTSESAGRTQATAAITVTGADGLPAAGVVSLMDGNRQLAQSVLNSEGKADPVVSLAGGEHALQAVYSGDATHTASTSVSTSATGQTSSTPNFTLSLAAVAPSTLPLSLSPGQSGTIAVTITPEDNSALTSPMFVTLSCSGLPSVSSCTFTPESIEILPTTPTSCPSGSLPAACPPVSSMLIQTQALQSMRVTPSHSGPSTSPVAWAILIPGVLGLGGLAFGTRRRAWLSRLALIALLGVVTCLGATACNPLYYYQNHGPPHPPQTPAGTYNIMVTAQTTDGVSAITNSTTMVLTVQ